MKYLIAFLFTPLFISHSFSSYPFVKHKWAIGVGSSAKINISNQNTSKYSPWIGLQAFITNKISAQNEKGFALLTQTGFNFESITYKLKEIEPNVFGTDHFRFYFNPQALYQPEYSKWQFYLGIGLEYNLNTRIWLNGTSSSNTMKYLHYDNLFEKERKLMPFVSLGILTKANELISLQFQFRGNLLNAYHPNETINFGDEFSPIIFHLRHQPIYLQIGLLFNTQKQLQ